MAKKKTKAVDTSKMEADLRFAGTYGDAITLLMAFFVILYAMSEVDALKFQLLVSGLADPFQNSAIEEGLLELGTGIVGVGYTDPEVGSRIQAIELVESPNRNPFDSEEREEEDTTLLDDEQLLEVQQRLIAALAEYGLEASVSQRLDSRGLAVSIATDDVLFASGSPVLSPEGIEIISSLTPIFADFENLILVEGHTDNVPYNRAGYSNWNLSADRALAVLEILEGSDINPQRLSATGYGEFRPVADNDSEAGRAANRRVELVIVAAAPRTTEN
jgi:chemotaxis protein MotB